MRLEFGWLHVTEFKSIVQLKLDLETRGTGLFLLQGQNQIDAALGSNGAGKSTIWDALSWCLTGRTPNGLRNPDIRPWREKAGPTSVRALLYQDGEPLKVHRSLSPNKIVLNDKSVSQEELQEALGFTPELLFNTIILGQGRPLFLDLRPQEQMNVFNEAQGLERWERRSGVASETVKTLQRAEARLEGEIAGLHANLEQLDSLLKDAEENAAHWAEEQRVKARGLDAEIQAKERAHEAIVCELGGADLQLDGAETEIAALEKEIEGLSQGIRAAQRKVDAAEAEVRALEREAGKLTRELEGLGKADTCPVCGQSIKGTDLAAHKKQLQDQLKQLNAKIKGLNPASALKGLEGLEARKGRLDAALADFAAKARAARLIQEKQRPVLAQIAAELKALKGSAGQAKEARSPYADQIKDFRTQQTALKKQIAAAEAELGQTLKAITNTGYWIKGFKDIRLNIIEETLHDLEETTNGMLPEVGLEGWSMSFQIERETQSGTIQRGLNVTVQSPSNRKPVRWECWSGGEAQRLRVVAALALSEVLLNYVGVQPGMEVLDEPTQHVSVEGTRDLRAFLAARARDLNRQIWWVDHLITASNHFSGTVTIRKGEEGSVLA